MAPALQKSLMMSILALIILAAPVFASSISGRIYDYALTPVIQGVVEIDTSPVQRAVAIDGAYRLEVPPGDYTLRASKLRSGEVVANASQRVSVPGSGDFTLDLILLPVLEEDVSQLEGMDLSDLASALSDPSFSDAADAGGQGSLGVLIAAVVVLVVSLILVRRRASWPGRADHGSGDKAGPLLEIPMDQRRSSGEVSDSRAPSSGSSGQRHDLDALLRALEGLDGRATQKALRKALPFSEAKVSLMVSELEHAGKISKIRKGRGNIIILKR